MSHPFYLVDVFESRPFSGNPLAVVVADDLSSEDMLTVCRWLNFSETAFLLTPDEAAADYRVRIFTPERELPFAGHPTLGTCHVWLERGGRPKGAEIVQECGAGLVRVRRDGERLAFAAPPLIRSGVVSADGLGEICEVLRIAPEAVIAAEWADNGPGWAGIRLASAEAVLALKPAGAHHRQIDIGVVGPHAEGAEVAWEIRTFFTDHLGTMREDPVTGSFNASAAQWLLREGLAQAPYVAAQGTQLGRVGRIYIDQDAAEQVWVGGASRTLFRGEAL